MRIVTSQQMKQIEKNSLEHDLTYARLMENAGSAAAAVIRRTFRVEGLNCLIFCGKGNNGGDGFVVARRLYENDANIVVVLVEGSPATDEARGMFDMLEMMEIPVFSLETDDAKIRACLEQADIIVDAIYGTGFHGELQEAAKAACGMIDDAIAAVIALDIPSGVACDSGTAAEGAVRADFTIAFDSMKPAHILPESSGICGKVELVEIGIPPEAREGLYSKYETVGDKDVAPLFAKRAQDAHKGDFGRLLMVCGCSQYRGTASLAAMGALRCGAGLICIASTESVCASVSAKLEEPMFLPLAATEEGNISPGAAPDLEKRMAWASAILFGCGIGEGPHAKRLLDYLLRYAKVPLIIDADGINALAQNIHLLQEAKAPVILTPHPGEMARLCATSVENVQKDRTGTALSFALKHGITVVLKGQGTLVAGPQGDVLINDTGNPGLAKGGSGDILAGMVGALVARGIEPQTAAAAAVHLHGLAADRTAARLSDHAMLPSELLQDIPGIILSWQQ